MANHKIVYLIVQTGAGDNQQTRWKEAGTAFECRDGSFNLKLDMFPGLTFNIRNPKSNGELNSAVKSNVSTQRPNGTPRENPIKNDDDIPF